MFQYMDTQRQNQRRCNRGCWPVANVGLHTVCRTSVIFHLGYFHILFYLYVIFPQVFYVYHNYLAKNWLCHAKQTELVKYETRDVQGSNGVL